MVRPRSNQREADVLGGRSQNKLQEQLPKSADCNHNEEHLQLESYECSFQVLLQEESDHKTEVPYK